MKKIALITLFMALTLNVISQETKNDTIVVDGDNVEILINNNKVKITDSQNGLKINVFSITENGDVEKNPYYESRYESGSSNTEKKNITINFPIKPTFIKDKSHASDEKKTKLKFYSFEPIYPTIYYTYSAMADASDLTLEPQRANSFEWGSYFSRIDICHNKKKTFGLTTAIGISNTYNHFDYVLGTRHNPEINSDNYTYFYYDNNDQEIIPDGMNDIASDNIKKSYLRYWSLRIPVNVQLQWRMGYKKMAFSFGPELEWRFAVKSKVKFEDGGKYTISDNLAYNPFGVNALAVFSLDEFVIFGRAGLTQLFNQSNSSINVIPINIGIGLIF